MLYREINNDSSGLVRGGFSSKWIALNIRKRSGTNEPTKKNSGNIMLFFTFENL